MKPLNYYANLPYPIATTPLSPSQLRQLIKRMLDGSVTDAPLDKPRTGFFPAWVDKNWETLCADPSGVVRWAAQYLQNAQDAIPQKISGVEHCKTDTRKSHCEDNGVQGRLAQGGCA